MSGTLESLRVQRSFDPGRQPHFGEDADAMPGTARYYRALMAAEFGPRTPTPTLAMIINGAYGARCTFNDSTRKSMFKALARTGVEASGAKGGFTVPPHMSTEVFDAARTTDGPLAFTRWIPSPTDEFWVPCTAEASRSAGKRWSGVTATWGNSETILPTPSYGSIGRITFNLQRVLIQTIMTNDLLADQNRIQFWLDGTAKSEIRFVLESAAMGTLATAGVADAASGPPGVLGEPACVAVTRTTSNIIVAADIDKMWAALYPGVAGRSVWHCTQDTLNTLDSITNSSGWPELVYMPAGMNPRWPYASLKGRPVIPLETAPPLASVGSLILVAWDQFAFAYKKMNSADSPLAFGFDADPRQFTGIVGLPENSVEARISDQALFLQDVSALVWKLRCSFKCLWPQPVLDIAGNATGPAVVLH